jgi:hypothetical protein
MASHFARHGCYRSDRGALCWSGRFVSSRAVGRAQRRQERILATDYFCFRGSGRYCRLVIISRVPLLQRKISRCHTGGLARCNEPGHRALVVILCVAPAGSLSVGLVIRAAITRGLPQKKVVQPHHAADATQPFRPVTIPEPSAAGSLVLPVENQTMNFFRAN